MNDKSFRIATATWLLGLVGCVATGAPGPKRDAPDARIGEYGGGSNCCEASDNGRTGCEDNQCQTDICAADPYCCGTEWDSICADAAMDNCSVCEPGYGEEGGEEEGGGPPPPPPPPVDEDTVCCVEQCCTTPWGQPVQCPPGEIGPFPSIDPSTFNCPVHSVPYTTCPQGEPNFDCDDFSYACKMWGDLNGYHVCQFAGFADRTTGNDFKHAINIVEFESGSIYQKYCFIEPQSNTVVACWQQAPGDPVPPSWAIDQLATHYNFIASTLTYDLWCEPTDFTTEFGGSNEACFTTSDAMCQLFEDNSGLCSTNFGPLPPPAPDPVVKQCYGINGNNETCYWDCPEDTACGGECYTCTELPPAPPPPPPPPPTPPYTNPDNCHDVNADGFVSSIDALLILNYLNTGGDTSPEGSGPPYYDTNGDGFISPIDALLVINVLNGGAPGC